MPAKIVTANPREGMIYDEKWICNNCFWKKINNGKGWCYMFREYVNGCKQFKTDLKSNK